MENLRYRTSLIMSTIFFFFALFVSFVLNFFFLSFLDIQQRQGLFCSVLFPSVLLLFCLLSGVFWCSPLACFRGVIRTRYVVSSFTFFLDYFAINIGLSVSHSDILCVCLCTKGE